MQKFSIKRYRNVIFSGGRQVQGASLERSIIGKESVLAQRRGTITYLREYNIRFGEGASFTYVKTIHSRH
jgi:hypothetical protein